MSVRLDLDLSPLGTTSSRWWPDFKDLFRQWDGIPLASFNQMHLNEDWRRHEVTYGDSDQDVRAFRGRTAPWAAEKLPEGWQLRTLCSLGQWETSKVCPSTGTFQREPAAAKQLQEKEVFWTLWWWKNLPCISVCACKCPRPTTPSEAPWLLALLLLLSEPLWTVALQVFFSPNLSWCSCFGVSLMLAYWWGGRGAVSVWFSCLLFLTRRPDEAFNHRHLAALGFHCLPQLAGVGFRLKKKISTSLSWPPTHYIVIEEREFLIHLPPPLK